MASFNVLEEGWIPVETLDGKRELLGIRQVLEQAHTLRVIRDASPLIEYSLYRFLQVFLMDALRPENSDELEDMLGAGKFDMEAVEAYIATCKAEGVSFDLFDEKRPFLQTIEGCGDKPGPVSRLDYFIPSGEEHTHFDHRNIAEIKVSYDEAARLLLQHFWFAGAEGSGYYYGINGNPPYYALVVGDNLFQTLAENMIPCRDVDDYVGDGVLWRSTAPMRSVGKIGLLAGMMFPARRIRLVPASTPGYVAKAYYRAGYKYEGSAWRDPAVAYQYRISKNKESWDALQPDVSCAVWKNLEMLYSQNQQRFRRPMVLNSHQFDHDIVRLNLYGVQAVPGKKTRMDVFRHNIEIPTQILADIDKAEHVSGWISFAKAMAEDGRNAIFDVIYQEPEKWEKKREWGKSWIREIIWRYDRDLEPAFWQQCMALATNEVQDWEAWEIRNHGWYTTVFQTMIGAVKATFRTINLNSANLMKLAEIEKRICTIWEKKSGMKSNRERKGDKEKMEQLDYFFRKLNELNTGDRAILRRSAGEMLERADGRAIRVFYHCQPFGVPKSQEATWFAIACLRCLWGAGENGKRTLPEMICELLKQGQMSKSAEHRVNVLLDTPWDSDGYMLGKLHQLITLVKAKVGEETPDFVRLHHDLLRWNWSSREVQLDWARALADISVKE